jgi:hypothetical protein
MFISKTEKARIETRIRQLEEGLYDATARLLNLELAPKSTVVPQPKSKKARTWTPEQRAEASERMKKRQADAKAAKVTA